MNLKKYDLPVALFLILNPLVGSVLFLVYIYYYDIPFGIWVAFIVMCAATNLSITAGYHRLFAHRSYETNIWAKFILLLVGSSAFQGSALKWSSDHRRHHVYIDTENDPYSIEKGFWYAHMGWLFYKSSVDLEIKAPDLEKDHLVLNQHKYYLFWAILSGYVFPILIGALWGAPVAGLILLGALRIFLTQQSTFFVNSLCHTLGKRTYSHEISARDSFLVAILTHGEGYHNFHHQFQIDYRNGIKWYHWDPTKWVIILMKWFGFAKKLKTIPSQEILKARLNVEARWLETKGISKDKVEQLKQRILDAQTQFKNLKFEYEQKRVVWKEQKVKDFKIQVEELRLNLKRAQTELDYALAQWRIYTTYTPSMG